jgi:hypothetical protein
MKRKISLLIFPDAIWVNPSYLVLKDVPFLSGFIYSVIKEIGAVLKGCDS